MSTPPEPLGTAVLPVVMHRLNNATQLLSALSAMASAGGGDEWLSERSDDLAHASRTIAELGYVLAVLSSAAGADLLLERRQADGIALVLDAVREAAQRAGRGAASLVGELPVLHPSAGAGWELPWAVGAVLFEASPVGADGPRLEVRALGEDALELRLEGVASGALDPLEPALRARLSEVSIEPLGAELRVRIAARTERNAPDATPMGDVRRADR